MCFNHRTKLFHHARVHVCVKIMMRDLLVDLSKVNVVHFTLFES